jgi:hypothetical protein
MKKNLVIGTLLISTILSVAAPAMAVGLKEAVCNIKTIITNDPRCRDRGPDRRDDRRDRRPPGGYARVEVRDINPRGEWVQLSFSQAVDLSSVEVRGFRDDVRIRTARVFLSYNRGQYDLDVRGPVVRLSGRDSVSAVYVWVEKREDRRGDRWDRRDRRDRWEGTDVEFIVNSDSGVPYVRVSR